jgi:signal transduction histidine kinase
MSNQAILLAAVITSFLVLLMSASTYLLYLFQKRKYDHAREIFNLREQFTQILLQSKLEIQEQILNHIAKELHANFGHLVSLININLSQILPQGSDEMKEGILETKSLAKQLLSELKELSASLNTDHIIHIGFVNALTNELDRLIKLRKYQVKIIKSGEEFRLNPEHEIILFRLCQEVLNNIIKYSKATLISITLDYKPNCLQLTILDNGVGFDVDKALSESSEKKSTGILNIKIRAKLIDAQVAINSKKGQGTSVELTVLRPQTEK